MSCVAAMWIKHGMLGTIRPRINHTANLIGIPYTEYNCVFGWFLDEAAYSFSTEAALCTDYFYATIVREVLINGTNSTCTLFFFSQYYRYTACTATVYRNCGTQVLMISYYSTYATVVSMRVWVHGATVYGVLSHNTMYRSILTTIYYIVWSMVHYQTHNNCTGVQVPCKKA
jgi:hypothetical protein